MSVEFVWWRPKDCEMSPRSNLGRMSQGGAARADRGARRQTTTSNSRREVRAQVKVSVNKKDSLRTIFEHFSRSACQQRLEHEFCTSVVWWTIFFSAGMFFPTMSQRGGFVSSFMVEAS